jgi:C4-dicarboxylate-specific signal transduction histidine kinase
VSLEPLSPPPYAGPAFAAVEVRYLLVCGGVLAITATLSHLLAVTDDGAIPWIAAIFFSVIALQGLLIVGLLLQRRWRRQAEQEAQTYRAELYHAMRLATLGELAASIAHEINQPLGAILSNADAAEMMLEAGASPQGELREVIADIRQDAQRASGIIRQTRMMIAKRPVGTGPVDLNLLVLDVRRFMGSALSHQGVTMNLQLDPRPTVVMGDTVQLQQVVLNLAVNALDATAGIPDLVRCLEVRTEHVAGDRVEMTVMDNGHGIPEDALPRLFEPFFTTKLQGCGLGLSIARSIVESHGGRISARNMPGGGAAFRIVLQASPTAPAMATVPHPARIEAPPWPRAPRGNEAGTKGH